MVNRLIEFRFWHITRRMMYAVSTINFQANYLHCQPLTAEGVTGQDPELVYIDELKINDGVLMQFTGLLDINGEKAFEGDVRYDYEHSGAGIPMYSRFYRVIYHKGGFCSIGIGEANPNESELFYLSEHESGMSREPVVGNIHKPPQLLDLIGEQLAPAIW